LYLTGILDLGDRKVIGWSLSKSVKTIHTTILAWKMAVKDRPITQELIFHPDRGVQYACNDFKDLLASYKLVKRSMSRKGDCWDNTRRIQTTLKMSVKDFTNRNSNQQLVA